MAPREVEPTRLATTDAHGHAADDDASTGAASELPVTGADIAGPLRAAESSLLLGAELIEIRRYVRTRG